MPPMARSWGAPFRAFPVLLSIAGCSNGNGDSLVVPEPDRDTVAGTVRRIDDAVPVDGGVDLELELDGGGTERAFLPSLFTHRPAPQERWEIYSQILALEIGDRITVEGERTEHGILIERLTVLTNENGEGP